MLGDLAIDYAARKVSVAGSPVRLTSTAHGLLCKLSFSAGQVLTFDHLLERLWGLEQPNGRGNLRSYVKRLRQKLGDDAVNPGYIFAEPRVAYRMAMGVAQGEAEE